MGPVAYAGEYIFRRFLFAQIERGGMKAKTHGKIGEIMKRYHEKMAEEISMAVIEDRHIKAKGAVITKGGCAQESTHRVKIDELGPEFTFSIITQLVLDDRLEQFMGKDWEDGGGYKTLMKQGLP